MGASGKKRKPSGFVSSLLLLAGCLLLYVSLPNLGNAVRTATADGAAGTFTADRLTCVRHPGHETCEWSGTFRAADGSVELRGVKFYGSGRDTFEAGQKAAALDVGNAGRVYDPSGSYEWIFTALLLIAGYVLLAVVAGRHLMPPPLPRPARPAPARRTGALRQRVFPAPSPSTPAAVPAPGARPDQAGTAVSGDTTGITGAGGSVPFSSSRL